MKIKDFKLGATGRFPYGQAAADDEGELRAAMTVDYQQAIIRVDFGKEVAWLALTSTLARTWAAELLRLADRLDRRQT